MGSRHGSHRVRGMAASAVVPRAPPLLRAGRPRSRAPYGQGPRLLDRVRERIRTRHYSRRTEKAYVRWIRRYVLFHGRRHPREMRAEELSRFLPSLAVDAKVSASTQNQALAALLYVDPVNEQRAAADGATRRG